MPCSRGPHPPTHKLSIAPAGDEDDDDDDEDGVRAFATCKPVFSQANAACAAAASSSSGSSRDKADKGRMGGLGRTHVLYGNDNFYFFFR